MKATRTIAVLLLSIVVAMVVVVAQQQPPGFQTFVEEQSLNYVIQQVLPILVQQVLKIQLPDIQQPVHTPIGEVDFTISNFHFNSFSVDQVVVHVVENTGFQILVNSVRLDVSANWHYREHGWPHVSDSGSVDSNAVLSATVLVRAGIDSTGRLQVDIDQNPSIGMSSFDIHLHGGASWLYNLFVNMFKGNIRDSIVNAIRQQLTGPLNDQLKKQVAAIQYVVPIGNPECHVNLDFTVLQTVFNTSYPTLFNVGAKGLFYEDNGIAYQGPPPPTMGYRQLTSAPSMIQLYLTDYVLNTAGWAWYQSGYLITTVTDKDIPEQVPVRLNTNSFQSIAPGLSQYPNTPMQIILDSYGKDASSAPVANITSSGANIKANGDAKFQIVVADGNPIDAFTLSVSVVLDVTVSVQGGTNIGGSLKLDKLELGLESSQIGDVNVQALNTFLGSILQYVVLPVVNVVLSKGFPIPTIQGLVLENPQIVFDNRFIGIASNFTFTPNPQIWRVV